MFSASNSSTKVNEPVKMYEAYNASAVAAAADRIYSPVTLSQDWPKMGRLLFMVGSSSLGSIMNGFFVAAFFVENSLRKVGNVFLASVGISDMLITTGVMPTCAVVLLSGQWDSKPVCNSLHFLTISATSSYSMLFMLVAMENYARICFSSKQYAAFISTKITLVVVAVFATCFSLAWVGVYMSYDYDYCTRSTFGNYYFRMISSIIFYVIPFIVTMFCLILSSMRVRRKARQQVQYKRSQEFERDNSSTTLHITAYMLFVVAWIPYIFTVSMYPETSDANFYHCAWLGMYRTILTSFLYACLNRYFRRAFAHLFNYCFCKSSLSESYNSRHRRSLEYKYTTGNVKVHIMHHVLSANTYPSRCGYSSRETGEL